MNVIHEKGVTYEDDLICIDLTMWTTQAQLSKKLNLDRNKINDKVRRGNIPSIYIGALGIRLIHNYLTIKDFNNAAKKIKKSH